MRPCDVTDADEEEYRLYCDRVYEMEERFGKNMDQASLSGKRFEALQSVTSAKPFEPMPMVIILSGNVDTKPEDGVGHIIFPYWIGSRTDGLYEKFGGKHPNPAEDNYVSKEAKFLYPDLDKHIEKVEPGCECGGTKTRTPHSTWCPVYGK